MEQLLAATDFFEVYDQRETSPCRKRARSQSISTAEEILEILGVKSGKRQRLTTTNLQLLTSQGGQNCGESWPLCSMEIRQSHPICTTETSTIGAAERNIPVKQIDRARGSSKGMSQGGYCAEYFLFASTLTPYERNLFLPLTGELRDPHLAMAQLDGAASDPTDEDEGSQSTACSCMSSQDGDHETEQTTPSFTGAASNCEIMYEADVLEELKPNLQELDDRKLQAASTVCPKDVFAPDACGEEEKVAKPANLYPTVGGQRGITGDLEHDLFIV